MADVTALLKFVAAIEVDQWPQAVTGATLSG